MTTGRVAWIVGASSGIGRSLARQLAEEGVAVAASARREDALKELAKEAAGKILPVAVDVTDEAAVGRAFTRIEAELGAVDLCVLCAGTHAPVDGKDLDTSVFRGLVEVNLMGVVHALGVVLPAMLSRKAGHLVVVSSVAGYRGLPTAAAYGATKAGLINMCESLAFDLDGTGVRLQLVDPGFVDTPLARRNPFPMPFLMKSEDAAARIRRGLASNRFEITFPRRFTFWLKVLRILPYALYFPLIRRFTGA